MGMSYILSLIAGITMTVILAAQVSPSLIQQIKVKKVENRTIANQDTIKEAIYRYILIHKSLPINMNDLINKGILTPDINNNSFDGVYTWTFGVAGTLMINTSITDVEAGRYFVNNFNNKTQPKLTSGSNYQTFYLIPDDIFKIYHLP